MSFPPDETSTTSERFARLPAALFSLAVIAATLSPVWREPPRDSFPLSTYPMFSTVRETSWLDVVVGFDEGGGEHRISPNMIANAEVMQAAQTIADAVRGRRAPILCEEVARRVVAARRYEAVVRLEVQSRKLDPLTYFASESGSGPARVLRRARCEVRR
jgi:hypothetical protein